MQTDPIYLTDTYQQTMMAHVLDIRSESGKRLRVILDRTVFYPMGGGQPTDQGQLSWHTESGGDSGSKAKVYQVLTKDGEIWHYIEPLGSDSITLQKGQEVEGMIDWERRYQNMRVHSAGHLLDFALFRLGYVPKIIKPVKGDHGKKPFVLYEGDLSAHPELTPTKLTDEISRLVAEERQFSWEFVSIEKLQEDAIYLQPGLPTNKPLRKLTLEGIGSVADGGTQVHNSREVGKVNVLAIAQDEGQIQIGYSLQ